jgi:hypothetical protein
MKDEHELPEAAKHAFNDYPRIEPSIAFNRAVLESLSSARSNRRLSLVGRIEEFLGLGLWQFVGSGALGALFPAVILSTVLLSGHSQQNAPSPPRSRPMTWPGFSPFGEVYRREHQFI